MTPTHRIIATVATAMLLASCTVNIGSTPIAVSPSQAESVIPTPTPTPTPRRTIDRPTPSPTPVLSTNERQFLASLRNQFDWTRPLTDDAILDLGKNTCEAVDRAQPTNTEELAQSLAAVAEGRDDDYHRDLGYIVGAAIRHLCQQWAWLMR